MKLATLKDGSRDGLLVVVSRDLTQAHFAVAIAARMQQLLDDWNFVSPQLEDLYATLNGGKARHAFAFDPRQCMAPLPRAFQWAEGSATLPHNDRVDELRTEPRLCQGASDDFLGPCDDAVFVDEAWGIDVGAGLAVITGDVAMGTPPGAALDGVRLLMLANSWHLRELEPAERATGCGFMQSRPATAFGPVAVTPDELGDAWRGGRVRLEIESVLNGQRLGRGNTGEAMNLHFGELVAHLAKTRRVRAGSIVGSGTLSHNDAAQGCHCIAEKRAIEAVEGGTPKTAFLRAGDRIRIEIQGGDGMSVFGAIEQQVAAP